jgi:hypothetical protein
MAQGQKKLTPQAPEKTSEAPVTKTEISAPDTASVLEQINAVQGRNKVTYGADEIELDFTGKTVASVRKSLGTVFGIPTDAQAYIKGNPVAEDYKLQNNESLEFLKQSGTKG